METPFTESDIARLSAQVDAELAALATSGEGALRGETPGGGLPPRQREAIESATGQDAPTFLTRFKAAAREDLCREGGVLYTQWRKYRDVPNKDVLNRLGGVLVGFGLSGNALELAVVAIAVYVLHIGLTAFCAGG
jgi:hypothetical protein